MKWLALSSFSLRIVLALMMTIGACLAARTAEPANPKATPQVRTILNYFHELSARKEGRRILSGQFSDFGNDANLRMALSSNEIRALYSAGKPQPDSVAELKTN